MEWLIKTSVESSVIIFMIIMIKHVLKNKLSARWHIYIWIVLIIRLFMPYAPQSQWSVFNKIPAVHIETVQGEFHHINSKKEVVNEIDIKYIEDASEALKDSVNNKNSNFIFKIWIFVAGGLLVYFIITYQIFKNRLKSRLCDNDKMRMILSKLKTKLYIDKEFDVAIGCDRPMIVGIKKPTIIIPRGYDYTEIEQILLHELIHYKNGDNIINLITVVITCIYWFNPLVWLSAIMIRRDIERLCDTRVMEITENPRLYAEVLLKAALPKNKFVLVTTSMQNGEKEIMKRIKKIVDFKEPKIMYGVLGFVIVVVLSAITLTTREEVISVENRDSQESQVSKIEKPEIEKEIVYVPVKEEKTSENMNKNEMSKKMIEEMLREKYKVKDESDVYINEFIDGVSSVEIDGKMGLVDKYGEVIIDVKYDIRMSMDTITFSEGLAKVYLGERMLYINKQDEIVIDASQYLDGWLFHEGYATVRKGKKWGAIDKQGKEVVSVVYDGPIVFNDGSAKVIKDGRTFFIDTRGEEIIGSEILLNTDKSDVTLDVYGTTKKNSIQDITTIQVESVDFKKNDNNEIIVDSKVIYEIESHLAVNKILRGTEVKDVYIIDYSVSGFMTKNAGEGFVIIKGDRSRVISGLTNWDLKRVNIVDDEYVDVIVEQETIKFDDSATAVGYKVIDKKYRLEY